VRAPDAELLALYRAVDAFAQAMKDKLHDKHTDGWTGWRDMRDAELVDRIVAHLPSMVDPEAWDPVDVANFAAFAWRNRGGAKP